MDGKEGLCNMASWRSIVEKGVNDGYFSDELLFALRDYNKLVEEKSKDFATLLSRVEEEQIELTKKQNEWYQAENERIILLDTIYTAQENEEDTTQLREQLRIKTDAVLRIEEEMATINSRIDAIRNDIISLRKSLAYENNLSPSLYDELKYYIYEDEWTDSNYIYPEDLLEEGIRKIKERNIPELNLRLSIVNFLESITEQRNWDKIALNDIVRVHHERLDVDIKAVLDEIEYDFEESEIYLHITNIVGAKSDDERLYRSLNDANTTKRSFDDNRYNWDEIGRKFDNRNNRISEIPNNPIVSSDNTAIEHVLNDDGSVNISFAWEYDDHLETDDNRDNIDGFIVYVQTLSVNEEYTFGSSIAKEEVHTLERTRRAIVLTGVPATKYYTFGVQAYRTVDRDISENGILRSKIIQPTRPNENPYRPMENVAFNGDITGTIGGVPFDQINKSPVTVIISSEDSTINWKQADYIVPKGTLDAQRIINEAINKVSQSGGGKVQLLEGNYQINGQIIMKSNIILEGSGFKTEIYRTSHVPVYGIYGNSIRNSTIKNLLLYRTGILLDNTDLMTVDRVFVNVDFSDVRNEDDDVGIYFKNSRNGKVLNCQSEYCYDGLRLLNCNNFQVLNGVFSYNGRHGIYFTTSQSGIQSRNNIISTNFCSYNEESGIWLNEYGTIHEDYQVTNNECNYNKYGIQFANVSSSHFSNNICNHNSIDGIISFLLKNTSLTTNTFSDNGRSGMFIGNSEDVSIIGNQCTANSKIANFGASPNIYLHLVNNSNIQNNTCRRGTNEKKPNYGIHLQAGDNNLIANNDLLNGGTIGGFLDQGTNTKTLSGNRV